MTRFSVRGAGLTAKKLDVALGSPNSAGGGGGLIGPGLAALCLGRNPLLGSAGLSLLVGALLGSSSSSEDESNESGRPNSGVHCANDSSTDRRSTSDGGSGGTNGVVAVVPRVVLKSLDLEDCGVKGDAGRSASKLHAAWRKQEKRGGAALVAAAFAKLHEDAASAAAAAAVDAANAGPGGSPRSRAGDDLNNSNSANSNVDTANDASGPSVALAASDNATTAPTPPLSATGASAATAAQSAASVAAQAPRPLYAHDMLKLPFAKLCNQLLASAAYRTQLVSLRLRGNKLGRHASTCLATNFLSSATALRVLDLAHCHLDLAAVVLLGLQPSLVASRATLPPPLLQTNPSSSTATPHAKQASSGDANADSGAAATSSTSPRLVGLASTLHTFDLSGSRLPDVAASTLGEFLALGCCGLLRGTTEGCAKLVNDPFFDHDGTSLGFNGVAAGPFGEGEGDDGSGLTVAEIYGSTNGGGRNARRRKKGCFAAAEDETSAATFHENDEIDGTGELSQRGQNERNLRNTAVGWPFGGPLRSVLLRGVVPGPSGVGGSGVGGDVDYSPMSDRGLEMLLMPLMGSAGALCARVTGSLAGTRAAPFPSFSASSSFASETATTAARAAAEDEAAAVAASEDEWTWGNDDGGGRGLALDLGHNALGTGKLGACLAKCCAHECAPLDLRWTADRVATTYQQKQNGVASYRSSSSSSSGSASTGSGGSGAQQQLQQQPLQRRVVRRRRCSPLASLKLDACALKKKDVVALLNAVTQRHALAGWVGLSLGSAVQV